MSRSRLVAVVAVALLAATTPAYAAKARPRPKPPICLLVKDVTGDAGVTGVSNPQTYDPSLDIVSMDIGVDATRLTAVIRVKDLTKEAKAWPFGRMWKVSMSNGTATLGLSAYISPLGSEQFSSGEGTFDWNADQIRVHAPLADYPNAKIKKGAVLRGFYVTSNEIVGWDPAWGIGNASQPFSTPADATDQTTASFTVGAASCVTPGK